jgi:predicted permease
MRFLERIKERFSSPYVLLILFIGVIVPRRLRADWRQEWEAELQHRERLLAEWDKLDWRNKFDLLRRSCGAFQDALLLQPQRLEDEMIQDLRFAVRSLRKHARLSIAVIVTLILGIGISTGIFTYYNADVLRARVDKEFDSFAQVYTAYTTDPLRPGQPGDTTLEDYLAFRDQAKSLGKLAAYGDFVAPLGQDDPVSVPSLLVSANFFMLYDLEKPLMGRLLQPEDCSGASPVVVLSEWLWRNRFAADPAIVGKLVHCNGQPVTVVGVAPKFVGMNGARAWFPYTLETYLKAGDKLLRPGEVAWLRVAGRLNPGFSHRDAAAELRLIASQQNQLHPGRMTTLTVTDGSAIQHPVGTNREDSRLVFTVLVGALIFIVLIVCVNVTTLLLARAAARRQEIAVRLALGAGRLRLIRMLLTETFLLATLAGLASFYLAYHLPDLLMRWLRPANELDTWPWSLAPDWRVFVFLTLVTLLAAIMAGLQPALQSLKVNLSEMLKGRQSSLGGGRGSKLYGLLIGAQIALSFFLLYGAGLFVSAAQQGAGFEPGFETRQVLWAELLMRSRATEQRNWGALHRALTERLAALPEVQSVAYSNRSFKDLWVTDVQLPGQRLRPVEINPVSSNYFTTLGIPILSGRALRESDLPSGQGVCSVVVSQQLVRAFWPDENPLGQTLRDSAGNVFEVVGVARDISSRRLGGLDDPTIYLPANLNGNSPAQPFVRFSGDQAALARFVTAAALELAPELSAEVGTIQSVRQERLELLRRYTQLIVLLCAIAVILAVIGIYGVVAFAVTQRTRELGIRLALGAQKKDIYHAVLGASGRPVAIGLLIGLVVTVTTFSALAPLSRNVGFTLNASDPIAYALTAILLAGVALLAMLIPARRATKIDPMNALRQE